MTTQILLQAVIFRYRRKELSINSPKDLGKLHWNKENEVMLLLPFHPLAHRLTLK